MALISLPRCTLYLHGSRGPKASGGPPISTGPISSGSSFLKTCRPRLQKKAAKRCCCRWA